MGRSANGAGAETARLGTSGPTARVVRSIVQVVDVWGAARRTRVCGATRNRRPLIGRGVRAAGPGAQTYRYNRAYLPETEDPHREVSPDSYVLGGVTATVLCTFTPPRLGRDASE